MPFDIEGARKEGYSESEIAGYLASQNKFDMRAAKAEGYSDAEIISHLSGPKSRVSQIPNNAAQPTPQAEPSLLDRLKGVGEAGLSMATGATGGALGYVGGTLGGIAGSVATGKFGTPEGARMAQEAAQEGAAKLTYQPRTETGQEYVRTAAEAAAPLAAIAPTEGAALAATAPAVARQARSMTPQVSKVLGEAADKAVENRPFQRPDRPALDKSLREARDAGYKTTPRQASPDSVTANMYEGLSGSAKMEKQFSMFNQKNTNRIAAEDLRLDPRKPITVEDLQAIRKEEGGAYQAVKNSGVTMRATEKYEKAISELGGDFKAANAELPGLIDNPKIDQLIKSLTVEQMSPSTAVEAVKYLRSESTKNLKAGFADPEKAALGTAMRKAANAIDDLIEYSLDGANKKELSANYQKARIRIAKTHSVEAALNDTTGNVDALHIAKMWDKGKPLSGGLEKIAKFADAFSGSARNVDNMKDAVNFSFADLALGAAGHLATGNYAGLAAVGARPAMRSLALSRVGQGLIGPGMRPGALK